VIDMAKKQKWVRIEPATLKRLQQCKLEHDHPSLSEAIRDLLNEHRDVCSFCDVQQSIDGEVTKP
jgi:hypothetical protein